MVVTEIRGGLFLCRRTHTIDTFASYPETVDYLELWL